MLPESFQYGSKMRSVFMGHMITSAGIHVEAIKIQAIKDWPVPKNCYERAGWELAVSQGSDLGL